MKPKEEKTNTEYDNTGVVYLVEVRDGSYSGNITINGVKHFLKAYQYNGKIPLLRLKVYQWKDQKNEEKVVYGK